MALAERDTPETAFPAPLGHIAISHSAVKMTTAAMTTARQSNGIHHRCGDADLLLAFSNCSDRFSGNHRLSLTVAILQITPLTASTVPQCID